MHNKINVSQHKIVSFNSKPSNEPYQASSNRTSGTFNKNASANDNHWRKFETFNFPINKASNFFFTLKIAYQLLSKLYITDNSITKENQLTNLQKAFKFNVGNASEKKALIKNGEEVDLDGALAFAPERTTDKFLELDMYNTEEKFFLNRVAYLNFKRRGAQATFDDFLKKIKVLEVRY